MAFILVFIVALNSIGQEKVSAFELSGAEFKFDVETHDFGDLFEGRVVKYEFSFENVGDQELNVYKVQADCDCISLDWTKEPLNPGESGRIIVSYDSSEKIGGFNKSIEILSDAKTTTKIVRIKGNVKEDFFKGK